jgi:hypothetical protein
MSNSFSAKHSKSLCFCLIFYHFFYLKHKENNDTFINLKNFKKLILDNNLNLTNKKPRCLAEVIKNKQYGLSPSKKDFWHQEELKLFFKSSLQFSKTYGKFAGKKGVPLGNFRNDFLRLTALKYKACIGGCGGGLRENSRVDISLFCNFNLFQRVRPVISGVVKFEPYPFYIRLYIPLYPLISPYFTLYFILFIRKVKISNNSKCNLLENQGLAYSCKRQHGKSQKSRSLSNFLKNKKLSWAIILNFFVMLCNLIPQTPMQTFENQKPLMKNSKNVMLSLSHFILKT